MLCTTFKPTTRRSPANATGSFAKTYPHKQDSPSSPNSLQVTEDEHLAPTLTEDSLEQYSTEII